MFNLRFESYQLIIILNTDFCMKVVMGEELRLPIEKVLIKYISHRVKLMHVDKSSLL